MRSRLSLAQAVKTNKSRQYLQEVQENCSVVKMTAWKGKLSMLLWSICVVSALELGEAKRLRIPIPISLLVVDAKGDAIIKDAAEITRKADIFMEDHQFIKRIAIVEKHLNRTANDGGIWNVDKCAFRNVSQNRRKDGRQAALRKSVRRTFGVTWSKIRHSDLKRPLYSVLAARIFLEVTFSSIPRGLRKQAKLWVKKYHECSDTVASEDLHKEPQRRNELENKFVRVIKSSCLGGYVRCEHFCHEKRHGRTECSCKEGFKLESDGASCSAGASRSPVGTRASAPARPTKTGCKNGPKCEHKCVTDRGVTQCTCYDGFRLHENGLNCVDIDECISSPCSQQCMNTRGSFYCSCKQGFQLQSDKTTCKVAKRLCSSNDIGCSQSCKESGNCSCPPGTVFNADRQACVEVNECAVFKGVCHQNCINTPRGYRCTCTEGYELNENGVSCSDVDECERGSHGCHHTCRNVPGSYFCSCTKGFSLSDDLKTCVDIDECALYPGICPSPSRCSNTIGGYKCDCPKGFTIHRQKICVDENECKNSSGGCSQICTNLPGSYRCSCKYGYKLESDRKTCTDIDECSRYSGLCQHRCVNTPGSYTCTCPPGQRQHPNFLVCMPL